jgi:hypothetical protein
MSAIDLTLPVTLLKDALKLLTPARSGSITV